MQKITVKGLEFTAIVDYSKSVDKSRQTIYNWINSGRLKSIKIGGATFVREA